MQPIQKLLTEIIEVQCLFEIIEQEYKHYYDSEIDVDLKKIKSRIENGKILKQKYLNFLN